MTVDRLSDGIGEYRIGRMKVDDKGAMCALLGFRKVLKKSAVGDKIKKFATLPIALFMTGQAVRLAALFVIF